MIAAVRQQLRPAFVLHQRAYRETSLLVEAFGAVHGRVGLVARGARSARSPLRGLLQPFTPLLLSWSGRGELKSLTGAEVDGPATALTGRRIRSGFYLNELMVRLTQRHDPHPGLYESYAVALARLRTDEAEDIVLRIFEKRLLQAIGYALVLRTEASSGEPVVAEREYHYEPDQGPIDARGRPDAAGVVVSGRTLLALDAERFDDSAVRTEAKRLMRSALSAHLGGAPLHSRSLFTSPGQR